VRKEKNVDGFGDSYRTLLLASHMRKKKGKKRKKKLRKEREMGSLLRQVSERVDMKGREEKRGGGKAEALGNQGAQGGGSAAVHSVFVSSSQCA